MNMILQDLEVNTINRTVHQGGDQLKLPDLSFDVLVALLNAAPNPMSTNELTKQVWQSQFISDDTIAQRIKLLRKAIGDNSKAPRYIRTIRGVGYSVLGDVNKSTVNKSSVKQVPEKQKSELQTDSEHPENRPDLKKLVTKRLSGTLLIFVIVVFTVFTFSKNDPENTDSKISNITSHEDVMVERAGQLLSLHQPEETLSAIAMLRQVLIKEPSHPNARLSLSFGLSTKTTKFGGSITEEKEAETIARQLIDEEFQPGNAWSALGYALSSQGRLDEALAAFRQSFTIEPKNAPALSSAAHILLMQGDLQQALLLESRVMELGLNSRYSEIQVAQILQLIDHQSAQKWLERAIASNPGQAVVIYEAARFQIRSGNLEQALSILEQFSEKDASAPQIMQLKGRVLAMLGKYDQAKASLVKTGWRGNALLTAIEASKGNRTAFSTYFPPDKLRDIELETDPELHIQLAEVFGALKLQEKAYTEITNAINLGWRDSKWLNQSPYLEELMASESGQMLQSRIAREVSAQRSLILQTPELEIILR